MHKDVPRQIKPNKAKQSQTKPNKAKQSQQSQTHKKTRTMPGNFTICLNNNNYAKGLFSKISLSLDIFKSLLTDLTV